MSKSKSDPFRQVGQAINGGIKNVEATGQDIGKAFGDLFSGNFNNLGNNVLRSGLAGTTAGLMSREDRRRIGGESSFDRKAREAQQKIDNNAVLDQQNQVAAQGQLVANTIMGLADAKKRTPGRRLVMGDNLLNAVQSNSLLTSAKSS